MSFAPDPLLRGRRRGRPILLLLYLLQLLIDLLRSLRSAGRTSGRRRVGGIDDAGSRGRRRRCRNGIGRNGVCNRQRRRCRRGIRGTAIHIVQRLRNTLRAAVLRRCGSGRPPLEVAFSSQLPTLRRPCEASAVFGPVVEARSIRFRRGGTSVTRGKHQLRWSVARRFPQEHIASSSIEQGCQDGRRLCRTVVPEDAFICHSAGDLHSGEMSNSTKNLVQAGVVRTHVKQTRSISYRRPLSRSAGCGWRRSQGDGCGRRWLSIGCR